MRVRSCILAAALLLPACASTPKATETKTVETKAEAAPASSQPREETITTEDGEEFVIKHGAKGLPAVVGCADGDREAFHDEKQFPMIAGCMASWTDAKSLRAEGRGIACGDEIGLCEVPADACAPNWHVCGVAGELSELRQVTAEQCEQAGGGRYSAAISHCKDQQDCNYDHSDEAVYECYAEGFCSEPVCCGSDCGEFGACTGGVWPDKTHIPVGTDQGCGAMTSHRAGGILCCR